MGWISNLSRSLVQGPVRTLAWTRGSGDYVLAGDDKGQVKFWTAALMNRKTLLAHKVVGLANELFIILFCYHFNLLSLVFLFPLGKRPLDLLFPH